MNTSTAISNPLDAQYANMTQQQHLHALADLAADYAEEMRDRARRTAADASPADADDTMLLSASLYTLLAENAGKLAADLTAQAARSASVHAA